MSLVPGRLKYVDSDENEQIIGVFRPSNPEDGTIQTFTIEESFRGYNRVIIEGEPTLQENMPTKISDFGTGSNNENEREIIAEIDPNGDGNWKNELESNQRMAALPTTKESTNTKDCTVLKRRLARTM